MLSLKEEQINMVPNINFFFFYIIFHFWICDNLGVVFIDFSHIIWIFYKFNLLTAGFMFCHFHPKSF